MDLRKALRKFHSILFGFGINAPVLLKQTAGIPLYFLDLLKYRRTSGSAFPLSVRHLFPICHEKSQAAGEASGHYFFQDLWAARLVFRNQPDRHVDIGSSINGFVSHLMVFREVEVIDIRPLVSSDVQLRFLKADATELSEFSDGSLESISSLHAAEHFGLGRYGDPVDPDAYLRFMSALQRVLRPGGNLYFSVPCGSERLEFNAHRVFDPARVLRCFPKLKLVSLSAVLDDGSFVESIELEALQKQWFGCGLFRFSK